MKNNRMDEWMEVPVALISTLLMLLVSWFVFDLFGFSCDQTWQFILLLLICFLASFQTVWNCGWSRTDGYGDFGK